MVAWSRKAMVEADYADLPLAALVGQAEAAVREGDRPTLLPALAVRGR